ncbi:MAG: phosphopyruvate hydratase [Candidatus Nanoarchaeia archaeon]
MVRIKKIHARQILDSRGNPTIETILQLQQQKVAGVAKVPSGASTGLHEALELRDNTKAFRGKGVRKATRNVNRIMQESLTKKTLQTNFTTQHSFDQFLIELDGTPNKSRLGANAILSASMAFARANANKKNIPLYQYIANVYQQKRKQKKLSLPVPFANIINGGVHANNSLQMQEFMIAPIGARSFSDGVQAVDETYHELKKLLQKKYGGLLTAVGDEGGFAPPLRSARQALSLLSKAVAKAGYEDILSFAMDPAASEFYTKENTFMYPRRASYLKARWSSQKLQKYYEKLQQEFPLISLEDPFDQDDFSSWKQFTQKNSSRLQIVGDDLTVSQPSRVQLAIDQKLCNSLLLKINQIGTISESLTSAHLAHCANWSVMVSHRSGETSDSFISDLAVGLNCGQIKIGAPCRSERVAKYNRLLAIEEELGKKVNYARWSKR